MDDKTYIEITDDPTSLSSIIGEMIKELRGPDKRASSREKALAITKLEEARFWLNQDIYVNPPPSVP